MIIKTVRVSDKGQIAIPTEIRKACGIERGTNLVLLEESGRILLEREEALSKKAHDEFRNMLRATEESLKEIWEHDEDGIWNDAGRSRSPLVPVHGSRRAKAKAGTRREQ